MPLRAAQEPAAASQGAVAAPSIAEHEQESLPVTVLPVVEQVAGPSMPSRPAIPVLGLVTPVEAHAPSAGEARVGGLRKRAVKVVVPSTLVAGTEREEKPVELPPIPEDWRNPVDSEGLKEAYLAFAEKMQLAQRTNLAATLRSAKMEAFGETIQLTVINEVQLEQLADVRPSLLDHMRRHLKNAALELVVQVMESEEQTFTYLSDRDRYDAFAASQPGLEVLRKRLDLDLR